MTEASRAANRKANVNEEHKEEAAQLSRIWRSTKHETQGVFGEKYEVGTQSAVGQFLRGESPLSLKAARGFATGLGCRIADFSPRLAKEAEQLSDLVNLPDGPAAELVRRIETAYGYSGLRAACATRYFIQSGRLMLRSSVTISAMAMITASSW